MASTSVKPALDEGKSADKKKEKRRDTDGVKKSKKEKKDKKKSKEKLAQVLDDHLQASAAASVAADIPMADKIDETDEEKAPVTTIRGALVEFALPMAGEKHQKKIYKCVKKAAKSHALLRGVKEVNKALRKSPAKTPSTAHNIPGIVIIAGDISPAEVIMHLPLACEDVNAPYMFVASRAELGAAAKTKRPTSVVMLVPEGKKGKKTEGDKDGDDADDYPETYQELVKMVRKEYGKQMRGMI